MTIKRLYHTIRLFLALTPAKRAEYLKNHDAFDAVGENCGWGPMKMPIYGKMIRLHDNVFIHKHASLITHDMVNKFLMKMDPMAGFEKPERLGCIEIMDNVYVSTRAIVMPNVRIGRNCLISAGAVVTGDVPDNSVVAGNPARVVGHMDSFVAWRLATEGNNPKFSNQHLPNAVADEQWRQFEQARNRAQTQTPEGADPITVDMALNPLRERIITLLANTINSVDLAREQALVDNNVLDSLSMMTVIGLLEESFSLKIPFSEVTSYNFNSVNHMARMIRRLTQDEAAANASNALVTADEKPTHTLKLNERDTDIPVVQRIFKNALLNPDAPAIIADDQVTSYGKLADAILSVSVWLREQGVRKGDRVCVQAIHEAACIACYYGIHLLGAILVPVEKSASQTRILEIAKETKASQLISLSAAQADIAWTDYRSVRAVMEQEHFNAETSVVYPELDWPCEMIFTTGTTGKSKGVLMTHRHISWYAYSVAKCVEMKENNRFLLTTPLNHAGGLRRTHLMLANACCIVYLDGLKDLGKYFETIEKHRVTSLYLPPVAIRILLSRTGDELKRFQNQIDFIYCSSSPLPEGDSEKLRELLPNSRLYNAYEASETPGVSAYNFNTDTPTSNCLGKPNAGVETAILLEDGTLTQKPDQRGQICVKSKMNMKEYFLEPKLTESVFMGDWFVSNDLGSLGRDGELYIYGRKGDVINIGGYKIAPTDVEEAALRSGLIDECICIEEFDEYGVPFLKLLVVCPNPQFDSKPLNTFLAEQLEAYKVPRKIERTDSICKTFNGKIDRKAYRKGTQHE